MQYSLTSCQLHFLVPLSSFLAHLLALSHTDILMSLLYNNNVNTITVKKNNVYLICLLQSDLNPDWYTSSFYPLVSKINSGQAVALNGRWSVQSGSGIRQPDEDGQPHQPDEDGQPDMDSLMNMDSWCSCVAYHWSLVGQLQQGLWTQAWPKPTLH